MGIKVFYLFNTLYYITYLTSIGGSVPGATKNAILSILLLVLVTECIVPAGM